MSGCRAVVFDLFGTVIPEYTVEQRRRMFDEMAAAIGVDAWAFEREWDTTAPMRLRGVIHTIEANVRLVAERLGSEPPDERIRRAVQVRMAATGACFRSLPGAMATLRRLREDRRPTALVSACTPEVPGMWRRFEQAALIDATVFSSEVGVMKPEPEIYLLASERIGVPPHECLYVGDGSFGELSGAAAVGMHPVLIRRSDEPPGRVYRPGVETWNEPVIRSLTEVPDMLEGRRA